MKLTTLRNIFFTFLSRFSHRRGRRFFVRSVPGIVLSAAVLWSICDYSLAGEKAFLETELELWHRWRAEKQEVLESIVEDFNCQHRNIRVLAEPLGPSSGAVAERLAAGSTAAELPDIALVEREAIPLLADVHAIRPLDELVEVSAFLQKAHLLDSAISSVTYKGNLYGLPAYLNPFVLIYNSELLTTDDVSTLPGKWVDLVTLARSLGENRSRDAGQKWILSMRSSASLFHILCIQRGVDLLDLRSDSDAVSDTSEILRFISNLRQTDHLLHPHYKFWDPKFLDVTSGKVYFQIDTAEMLPYLLSKTSVPIAVAPVPSDSAPAQTYLAGSPVFVVSASNNKDSAVRAFLEFFYMPEQYSRFPGKNLSFVSPYKHSVSKEEETPDGSLRSQLLCAAENARALPLHPRTGEAISEINRVVEQLDAGLISPERALDKILEVVKTSKAKGSAPTRTPVRVTWAESTRRLRHNDISNFRAAPVEIISAHNEHETFQLALSADRKMTGLRVSLLPFVSENGKSYKLDTLTYLETDTCISVPLVAKRTGLYPNILKKQGEFSVEPGALTRIWVDIFVPEDVPTGKLSSRITVQDQGSIIADVPIQLQVHPLCLSTAPSQSAVVGLDYELIARYYDVKKEQKAYQKLMDSFFWFMVEHRLSPYQPPVSIDSEEADTYLKDDRVSGCRFPFPPNDRRFQRVMLLAREGGWLEKLFVYFIDEPTYHQYGAIIHAGENIHSTMPSPKFLVTCFPDAPLVGAVDIWCILMRFLPEGLPHGFADRPRFAEGVSRRLKAGDEVWWYTAGPIKPFPTLHIEDDPVTFRIIPWLQQLYGITGFLHWESANWSQPLEEPFVPYFGNGEGVLVYPGELEPWPSIRLELLREGLEDMEHLMLLRRALENAQKKLKAESLGDVASVRIREICRRLISEEALRATSADAMLLPRFIRESGVIERVRKEVMNETATLESRPFAVVLTEPEEKRYTDSANVRIFGVTEPGSKIEVNAQEVEVERPGNFSVVLPLKSGTNLFSIHIEKGRHKKTVARKIEKL